MEKVLFFSWHEIEVSIRIAFHAIKNITSDILSEIILQNKSRQTENSVGDIPLYINSLSRKIYFGKLENVA